MLEKIILFALLVVSLYELIFDTRNFFYAANFIVEQIFEFLNYLLNTIIFAARNFK